MFAVDSQNLPRPLEQAEAVYRDAAAQLPPVTAEMIALRAGHFAAGVRLSLDAPQAIRRLHEVTGRLHDVSSLSTLLPRVLDGAMSLTGADLGNVRLRDPVTGVWRIVTQCGFDPGFLDYFAVVDPHSARARATKECIQAVIPDINTDPDLAPYRDIAATSGFRAVQSTPLVNYAGRAVGMISTHFRRPYRPPDLDLRVMELYADVAGEAVAAHLGVPGDDGLDDPIGRAVISALLDPGDGQVASVTALPGPGAGRGRRGRGPVREAAYPEDAALEFAGYTVNRLFSVGLSLESARSIIGPGPAGDHITAAIDEIDQLINDIRTALFSLAADRPTRLRERLAQTARAFQVGALDAVALLEQRAGVDRRPGRIDYPAEIKRWRAFADQAEQMAKRWEQLP